MNNYEKISELLRHLGAPGSKQNPDEIYNCPLHPARLGTLKFSESAILPGGFFASCSYPKCRFRGSVAELAATARKAPLAEALTLFAPGGPLYLMFFQGTGNEASDKDVLRYEFSVLETSKKIWEYLDKGRQEFLNLQKARMYLVSRGVRESLLAELGCSLLHDNVPDVLLPLLPQKNRKAYMAVPASLHGIVTELALHNLDSGERKTVEINGRARGVFLEHMIPQDCKSVMICASEIDAMILHGKIREAGCSRSIPVALAGPSALDGMSATMIGHTGNILQPGAVLAQLRAASGDVRVLQLQTPLRELSSSRLSRMLDTADKPWPWIASSLLHTYSSDGLEVVSGQLGGMGLSSEEKTELSRAMSILCPANSMLLREIRNSRPACLVKSYGPARIKRGPAGYEQMSPVVQQLSNFSIVANYYIESPTGKLMAATVKTDAPGCPGYNVLLPVKSLATKNGDAIAYLIWERLLELGAEFSPYAGSPVGIDWFNMVRIFDIVKLKSSARLLGMRKPFLIYPRARLILDSGACSACEPVPGLPGLVTEAYSEIRLSEHGAGIPAGENARLLVGIMGHMMRETAAAALSTDYVPRHLLIPYALSDSPAESMIRQLSWVTGGLETILEVPESRQACGKFFQEAAGMPGLPVMCKARELPERFASRLNSARNSFIVLYPEQMARALRRVINCCYMDNPVEEGSMMSQDALTRLRDSWLPNMAATLSAVARTQQPRHDFPGAEWAALMNTGLDVSELFRYAPPLHEPEDVAAEFFRILGIMLRGGEATIAVSETAYRTNRRASDVGYCRPSQIRLSAVASHEMVRSALPTLPDRTALHRKLVLAGLVPDKAFDGRWTLSLEKMEELTGHSTRVKLFTAKDLGLVKSA